MSTDYDPYGEAFWENPQKYIDDQINAGVRRGSVQQEFQQKYPDIGLELASHLASQHADKIQGMSDSQAMAKIASIAREQMGNAQAQGGTSANPGSTTSILKARKQRRREAKAGFVAQPKR